MVAIADRYGTSVTALTGGGYRIVNTGGSGAFDASAVSTAPIAGDFVMYSRASPGFSGFAGVTADPTEDDAWQTIDFAMQIYLDDYFMSERGVYRPPTAQHGGAVWIERRGATLRYRTGARYATSIVRRAVDGVVVPLFFDSSIATIGGVLDVRFEAPGGWLGTTRNSRIGLGF